MEEALRYMHVPPTDEATRRLAEEAAGLMEKRLHPRYLWRAFRLGRGPEGILPEGAGFRLTGKLAEKMLSECDTAALLVCTLGAGFERLMQEWEARDMAKAAVMDFCGGGNQEPVSGKILHGPVQPGVRGSAAEPAGGLPAGAGCREKAGDHGE